MKRSGLNLSVNFRNWSGNAVDTFPSIACPRLMMKTIQRIKQRYPLNSFALSMHSAEYTPFLMFGIEQDLLNSSLAAHGTENESRI